MLNGMHLNAEQRTVRARNAAYARHHPGADPAELERQRTDRAIDEIIARAPQMTKEQATRLQQLARHPCAAEGCRNLVGLYQSFCGRHRV